MDEIILELIPDPTQNSNSNAIRFPLTSQENAIDFVDAPQEEMGTSFYRNEDFDVVSLSRTGLYTNAKLEYDPNILMFDGNVRVKLYANGTEIANKLWHNLRANNNCFLLGSSITNNKLWYVLLACYGKIQFTLSFDCGNNVQVYYSNFITINLNDSMKMDIQYMIQYIRSNMRDIPLLQLESESSDYTAIYDVEAQEEGVDLTNSTSLENINTWSGKWYKWVTRLQLAQKIISKYNNVYEYFRTEPYTRIKKDIQIGNCSQLRTVTSSTIHFVMQHPEQLQESSKGIHIHDKCYKVKKTEMLLNIRSCDIYENQIVLGFLQAVLNEISVLYDEVSSEAEVGDEYFEQGVNWDFLFKTISNQLTRLRNRYHNALPVSSEIPCCMPRATEVFLNIPAYREIYNCMKEWFNYNSYGLNQDEAHLPFIQLPFLYEDYVFVLLLRYFKTRENWEMIEQTCFQYVEPTIPERAEIGNNIPWKYKNKDFYNTFVFSNHDSRNKLTFYYQPVIYNIESGYKNGIDLYRECDNITSKQDCYYTPDFIVKIEKEGGPEHKYLILDTKFSTSHTVKSNKAHELGDKYHTSINNGSSNIVDDPDIYIIYGIRTSHEVDFESSGRSRYHVKCRPVFATNDYDNDINNDNAQGVGQETDEQINFERLDDIFRNFLNW